MARHRATRLKRACDIVWTKHVTGQPQDRQGKPVGRSARAARRTVRRKWRCPQP